MPLPSRVPVRASLSALVAVALLWAVPGHAGIGDMMNKAKKALGTSVTPKSGDGSAQPCKDPEFTHVVLELTPERVAKMVDGLKLNAGADAQRVSLQQEQEKVREQMTALQDKYGHEIDLVRQKRDQVLDCYRDVLEPLQDQHQAEMQQKMMSDPALRQQIIDMSQQMAKAQAAGDTATMARLQRKMQGLSGNTHEDTLAAQKKCGTVPPLHPQQAKLEELEKRSAGLDEQMREVDRKLHAEQERVSGLDAAQFAMARERIEMVLARARAGQKPCGVTAAEAQAIEAHRAQLEAALKTS